MKSFSYYLLLLLLFIGNMSSAQDGSVVTPSAYSGTTKVNYVRTWDAIKPDTASASFTTSTGIMVARMSTQYLDGLGRPIQTVVKQGSMITGSGAADLVMAQVYDSLGREVRQYLPFAANTADRNTSTADGLFKSNPFQQQQWFYSDDNSASPVYGQGETYYYGKTELEASPLNRTVRKYAPGDNWVSGSGRGSKIKYRANTALDSVYIWDVSYNGVGSFGDYSTSGRYAAGMLYKTITVDENDKQVIEFKDKEGQLILKKLQTTASADDSVGKGHYGWLCTYYLYDDLNHLRAVIQPKGVELLAANSWDITWNSSVILNEQCFRYEYDAKGRMTMKKVPGAGEVYMVYDARDRLVLVQDARLRNGSPVQWLYTQYDELNRPIATGLWNNSSNLSYHAPRADTSIAYPDLSGQTYTELTHTFYDNYAWRSSYSNPLSATRSTSYDSYLLTPSGSFPYPRDATTQNNMLRGMVTGTRTKVLDGGSTYLYSVNFYDEKNRVIQTQSTNLSGGTDIATTQYSFTGQPLLTISKIEKGGTGAQTTVIVTQMTLDSLGRVVKTEKKLSNTNVSSGSMSSYKTQSELEYDALGQVKKKKLGAKSGGGELSKLDYAYNIRGWLLSINKGYLTASNSDQYFGMELGYDKNASLGTFSHEYNGNISGMLWKTEGDQEKRKYDFSYDAVNRLTGADFNQYVSGSGSSATFNKSAGIDFSVTGLTYDANGNILTQNQRGWKITGSATIDSLLYTYIPNTNRLKGVWDRMNDTATILGDFRSSGHYWNSLGNTKTTGSTDYTYDDNGNLLTDQNKNISAIDYNYLNLPESIGIRDKDWNSHTIAYVYDAAGNKLKKAIDPSGANTTTLYLGSLVFQNDSLQFVLTEEGRIRFKPADNSFQYDYFLKDHLGNVRTVLTEEQQTDYYPATTLEGSQTNGATSMVNYEKQFYNIDNAKITATSSITGWSSGLDYANNNGNPPYNAISSGSYPSGYTVNEGSTSVNMYKTNANSNKTALGFVAKVMAGDVINIFGKSYYYAPSTTFDNTNSSALGLADIFNQLLAVAGNPASARSVSEANLESLNSGGYALPSNLIRGSDGTSSSQPKAYVNYIILDNQLRYVSSGYSRAGSSGSVKSHWSDASLQNIAIPKNGYIYVYVSNESNQDVYFDNLQIVHKRSPILEESHYYPFGLTMSGISSSAQAFGSPQNKYKYNKGSELQSKELSDGSGLELYATPLRSLDPQLGRWWQTDPKPDYAQSQYASMGNNPLLYNDPLGDTLRINYKGKDITYNDGKLYNRDGSAYAGKVRGYLRAAVTSLGKLNDISEGHSLVRELEGSDKNFVITNDVRNRFEASRGQASFANIPEMSKVMGVHFSSTGSGGTIFWNPNTSLGGVDENGGVQRPIFIALGHELGHAVDANRGIFYPVDGYTNPLTGASYSGQYEGIDKSEWRGVFYENRLRLQSGLPLRSYYGRDDHPDGTYSATGPSMVLPMNLFGIPLNIPINYPIQ